MMFYWSVCYTLVFILYLITSFSQQFNVFVFGSCCCFGFSIFLLWFIPSLVIVMCYTVLWFFMNVMLSRPSMKEYDFSVASDFVLLTTRTLWFLRTSCFWVPPCFQYDPYFFWLFHCSTLMHHVFSNLFEHFLLRSITFWFFEADAVLCAPSFQLDIYQVLSFWCVFQYFDFWWIRCAAPVRWSMIFMMQLITRSAHNSNILHFGRFCFWVPLCFNQELPRFFRENDVLLVQCATPWLSFSTW